MRACMRACVRACVLLACSLRGTDWAVITMTTVGFGDLTPNSDGAKALAIVLLPLSTAALAVALSDVDKISTRNAIRKASFRLQIKSLLQREAMGDPRRKLTKEAFLLAVLREHDLVDQRTLSTIEAEFDSITSVVLSESKDVTKDENHHGSTGSQQVPRALDCRTVYAHLVRQRQVRHREPAPARSAMPASGSAPWNALFGPRGEDDVPMVDMSESDHGFAEWYELYWSPAVLQQASDSDRDRNLGSARHVLGGHGEATPETKKGATNPFMV